MNAPVDSEWKVLTSLLPNGWEQAARQTKAFQNNRQGTQQRIDSPALLLRVLLAHAASAGSLRASAKALSDANLVQLSHVALLKRLGSSADWLAWLASALGQEFRQSLSFPEGFRLRLVDGSSVTQPASSGTDHRLHYSLDLLSLHCDWLKLTDAQVGEALSLVPVAPNDILFTDRNFLTPAGLGHVRRHQGHVIARMRWTHSPMLDAAGKRFSALKHLRSLKTGQVGQWKVSMFDEHEQLHEGRVVALRLPAPLAAKAKKRVLKEANRKGKKSSPESLLACQFVMVFTTLPEEVLSAEQVLELYRYRWQIELAFKRLKQLLKVGQVPHKQPEAARGWILAKLVLSLLLEKLYRNARSFSPWGYQLEVREAA